MRRRDLIGGAGATLLASPSLARETTRIPTQLPSGTREIAQFADLPEKRRLLRLTDRPMNYETPVNVFTDNVTPNDRFFVRYHLPGLPPVADSVDWRLSISGDGVEQPVQLKLNQLLDLPGNRVLAVCQCASNRRGLVDPHVAGVQWGDGAMGCALWHGPALRDVLAFAKVKPEALEVWLGGSDKPALEGTPPYRKSLPIEKAMAPDTIVALAMNNAPLPQLNGNPARLVVPGWTGTYWMKHLNSIEVSTQPLKNFWMQTAYRVPAGLFPVDLPFSSQATETTVPVTELVVNSIIAEPLEGDEVDHSGFTITGVAWDKGAGISRVEVSLDAGRNWQDAQLDSPLGGYAFRRFIVRTDWMTRGPYGLMSRATSHTGERQPDQIRVNPGGYNNNAPRMVSVVVK